MRDLLGASLTTASAKVRAAAVSLATGMVILALKAAAYVTTGSVALLSDAAESIVNVAAANFALLSLIVAARPPDDRHQYGHAKVEYVSSATEAALIAIAGAVVIVTALTRFVRPAALEHLPMGLALSVVGAVANLVVALLLLRISRAERSIALEASARHLLSDVYTTAGVFGGMILVIVTGWTILDPIAAAAVGINILWTGARLYARSISGLMDTRLPEDEEGRIRAILDGHRDEIVGYHGLRTRQAGADRFLDLHLVVHRTMTVGDAHTLTDDLERHLGELFPGMDATIHVEPCEASCARCRRPSTA
jgi:cation diffusion facilitator family transporter